jgi:hypothetical protein
MNINSEKEYLNLIRLANLGEIKTAPKKLLTQENLRNERENLFLVLAINGELNEIPQELLTEENLTSKDYFGRTPLHNAAANGHLDQIPKQLLTEKL